MNKLNKLVPGNITQKKYFMNLPPGQFTIYIILLLKERTLSFAKH